MPARSYLIRLAMLLALAMTGCAQEARTVFEVGAGGKAVVEAPIGTYRLSIANHGPGEVQVAAKDRRLRVQSQMTLEPNTLRPLPVFHLSMGRYEVLNLSGLPARIRVHVEGREATAPRVDLTNAMPVAAGLVD